MIRLLGALGLLAPIGLALLVALVMSSAPLDDRGPGAAAVAGGLLLGTALVAAIVSLWLRARIVPVVQAIERVAGGDTVSAIPAFQGGLGGRLADALRSLAATLAETHDAATTDRLTGIANRPAILAALFGEVERADRTTGLSQSPSSTSTTSRPSTTPTATRPGTWSCAAWPRH